MSASVSAKAHRLCTALQCLPVGFVRSRWPSEPENSIPTAPASCGLFCLLYRQATTGGWQPDNPQAVCATGDSDASVAEHARATDIGLKMFRVRRFSQ